MIELSEQQRQHIQENPDKPLELVDPATRQTFVLIRTEAYRQLIAYDDSPWTDEERDALAWEAGQTAGWNDMDDYDSYPKKP